MNRRQLLYGAGIGLVSGVVVHGEEKASGMSDEQPRPESLALSNYQPTSMLHVPETHVERALYPVIDIHTHITESNRSKNGVDLAAERNYYAAPDELIPVMLRKNIRSMVNLTGGFGLASPRLSRNMTRVMPTGFTRSPSLPIRGSLNPTSQVFRPRQ